MKLFLVLAFVFVAAQAAPVDPAVNVKIEEIRTLFRSTFDEVIKVSNNDPVVTQVLNETYDKASRSIDSLLAENNAGRSTEGLFKVFTQFLLSLVPPAERVVLGQFLEKNKEIVRLLFSTFYNRLDTSLKVLLADFVKQNN